jgi:hypothetical protein
MDILTAMRTVAACLLVLSIATVVADAQSRRRAAPQPATKTEPARIECPHVLGEGVRSGLTFCDIWTGRESAAGAIVRLPPRRGPATLTFDLHNRQTYSASLEKAGRAYTRTTATIGVLTLDEHLLGRAVIQTEFRGSHDLIDRIAANGRGDVKAVAPVGREPISVEVPESVEAVSLVGERASIRRIDGEETISTPGRPVAIVSNVKIEYRPAPARRPGRRR